MSETIKIPSVLNQPPSAGWRVRMTAAGWEGTSVYHAVWLPENWTPEGRFPVIAEYPGNGGYAQGGDVSHGTVEDCALGYGLSAGAAIWVCLPFVEARDGYKQNCVLWWGDAGETARYARAAVREVCARFGGERVVLAGFSRGSLAAGYIGLRDDGTAALWSGFFCHSHFDGVREDWPYADADRQSATQRWRRLAGRPVWVSQEGGTAEIEEYARGAELPGVFTFGTLPGTRHTARWMLRDSPLRVSARAWWRGAIAEKSRAKTQSRQVC